MPNIPFIFCAFANDKARYLNQLPHEANDIATLFRDKEHLCEIEVVSNTRPVDLFEVITSKHKDIHIVHYGGHADGYQTYLTNDNHGRNVFHGSGLVGLLKGLPNLKLVFINGCKSEQMVNELYNAGIPAVIGTTIKINDTIAYQLSVAFYAAIAKGLTIAEAWQAAKSYIEGMYKHKPEYRTVIFDDGIENITSPHRAWFIKFKEGAGDWGLDRIRVRNSQRVPNSNPIHNPPFPRFHNTSQTPLSHKILGRDTDLAAVHQKLLAQKQCVVLNGLGGIGKSSLAKLYIQQYHADYQHIIWLYEKVTAADILLTDIELQIALQIRDKVLQCIQAQDERGAITTIIQALNDLPNPVLLIADNVTNLKAFYDVIQHLNKSHYHILFTSRQETTALHFHKLNTLDKIAALEVFMLHYNGAEAVSLDKQLSLKNNTALPLILETAQRHTLTIELLAKVLRNSNTLTPEKLLARLQEQLLIPKITQTIDTAYTPEQATLLEILLAAFDIGDLAKNEAAFTLLAEWAVLPATPIPHTHLLALFGVTDDNEDAFDAALTFLIQNAWIQKGEEEETTYACHALIQEAVRWQLQVDENDVAKPVRSLRPDRFSYTPLIERLTSLFYYEAGNNPLEKTIWLPYAANMLSHLTAETEALATLSNNTAEIYRAIGDFTKSLEYGLKSMTIREKVLSPEHPNLANSYNNIAETYRAIGNLPKALEYGLKSLAIREKILSPEHTDLAQSYNNIAATYEAMGDLPKSLEYGLLSMAIREKILSPEHPDLAQSYNNIAATYMAMGDLSKSLEYGLKSIEITEKILSYEHPDLATSYNNIAVKYEAMGNLPKSLEYGLKSLEILKKVLSSEHPDLATSYNNMALTYQAMGDLPKSLEYGWKSLAIREKVLSLEHPNLAQSYNNITGIYQAIGDLPKSLEYGLKSLAICKKVFSPEHPHLATTYNNIAVIYYYLQDYLQSLAYLQKAIQIQRKSLPKGHPDTKGSINSMDAVLRAAIAAGQGEEVAAYIAWYVQEIEEDVE